jgi:hypothetical protein
MNRYKDPIDPDIEEQSLLSQAAKKLGISLDDAKFNRGQILDEYELGKLNGLQNIKRQNDLKERSRGREMAKFQASSRGPWNVL